MQSSKTNAAQTRLRIPLGILVALLLFVVSAPNYAAQTQKVQRTTIFVTPAEQRAEPKFETRWNALSLIPERNVGDPIPKHLR